MTCGSRENNVLCSLERDSVEEINRAKIQCKFKKGQSIFMAGNTPPGLYCISSGVVKLETPGINGDGHILRMMKAGDVLGYRSLFANEPYTASAVVVEDVEACLIPRERLTELCEKSPQLTLEFLKYISTELRKAEERLVAMVDKDATERVAEALLFLKENFANPTWTRREIAEWAGTTPETVMRTLAAFEDEGLIRQEGRRIEIVDRESLISRACLAL
jgi:CRP-like cAMP-binding protein